MGETISFAANGGSSSGYLASASQENAPGVVVIQEWWGINHHIQEVVERFAAAGFTALAPDLYHGHVATEPDDAAKTMMAMSIAEAAKDIRGALTYLQQQTGRPVGIIGFCMGGALSLFAACDNPELVGAAIDFYGGHPAVQYDLPALKAPVLGIFGTHDHGVSPEAVANLDRQLTDLGKEHSFFSYEADHAFFNNDRPQVYNDEAATDAWEKTLAFLTTNLS